MKETTRLRNTVRTGLAAIGLALVTGGLSQFAMAQDAPPAASANNRSNPVKPDYSPYPDQKFPTRAYWGVAHVNTSFSFDSWMFGVTVSPDDLFRVATGGEVVMDNGQRFKQDRPLDWVSVHHRPAEAAGIALFLTDPARRDE